MSTDIVASSTVEALIDVGHIDTSIETCTWTARTLFTPVLSVEDFRRLEQQRAEAEELPRAIARALESATWSLVAAATRVTASSTTCSQSAANTIPSACSHGLPSCSARVWSHGEDMNLLDLAGRRP